MRIVMAFLGCALVAGAVQAYQGKGKDARQSYGNWQYNKEKNYHYREYKFKPKKADTSYKTQYVIYYKDQPKKKNWVYMYNPETKKYWCRYPTVNNPRYGEQAKMGKELWCVVPKEKQYGDVDMIAESSYGKPGDTCPTIPGSNDNTPIDVPPPDLP